MTLSAHPHRRLLWAVFRRDVVLGMRREALTPLAFFSMVICLFVLGVGPDAATLRLMAPGVVWVGALLASMLSLPRMFAADYAEGSLEQLLLSQTPPALWVLTKIAAHFVVSNLPLVLVSPIFCLQFGLDDRAVFWLMLSLLLGTPVLSLIGSICAALTLGLRHADVLMAVLILPLLMPVLIFGAGVVHADAAGLGVEGYFSMLAALLVLSLFFAPLATVAAIKISLE